MFYKFHKIGKFNSLKINVNIKVLVSGGVDSTVCAALLRQALREDQVIAAHIDNGKHIFDTFILNVIFNLC